MKRRIVSLLLLVSFVFCLILSVPISGNAAENDNALNGTQSGITGDCSWTVEGTKLTINGSGSMPDYETGNAPWTAYSTIITEVKIGDSILNIGDYAFYGFRKLKNVTIGNSINSIGVGAFKYCGITNISLDNQVTEIRDEAFAICEYLTSLYIGDAVKYIGQNAFDGCKEVLNITIGKSVEKLWPSSFGYCTKLESINVASGNMIYDSRNNCNAVIETSSGKMIFGCKNTIIPQTVKSIGTDAFLNCVGLESITIPNSVTSIETQAFWQCSNLKNLQIGDSVTTIGTLAFYNCQQLNEIVIPNSVTRIDGAAFYGCSRLSSVRIPNSVRSIGYQAFGYKEPPAGSSELYEKINSFVIYGYKNTVAEQYAKDNEFSFIEMVQNKSIEECAIILSQDLYYYDGTAKKPTVTVKYNSVVLSEGTDYTVSYKNNVNVGTATATVTGIGDYTGIVDKTFTITAAPKINITNCTITLNQSSYTYDGTAKKPVVTVKYNNVALIKDTDFTVSYLNNINVGTAIATVTGKGNYTGTVSKNFTINPKQKEAFVWAKDNWNFNNSATSGYFKRSTYRNQISDGYLNVLKKNLSNSEYEVIFNGTYYGNAWLDNVWSGSCYGMSSTALLSKEGILPYSNYKSGATKLYDLNYPIRDNGVSSLVTYYQMLQVKDIIQQQYRTVPSRSNETNIKNIISLLDSHSTVLIGFKKDGWGGHAILATGYEYGSWTWNRVTYQGCIKICDPNCSRNYSSSYNIYFNTQTYNWIIPGYTNMTSSSGAKFNYIGANVNEINKGGYLSGTTGNRIDGFVARIDAAAISDNRSVTKVIENNGNYINQNTAPGDIEEDYSYVLGNESEGTIGYNLYDPDSAYRVSQTSAQDLQLGIDYENCNLYGGSAAGKAVLFDKSGYVEVRGETADYNMSMTFDEDYPTDWFTIHVEGTGANNASLQKKTDGYVINSDNLENVSVSVNNREDSASITLSTSFDSVFIYEVNSTTIGAKVDKDKNGTFETDLAMIGDTNGDKNLEITDATFIERHIAKLETPFSQEELLRGDVDMSGELEIIDVTAIQYALVNMSTPYKPGVYCDPV